MSQVKDALFPLLERVLTDVINDAMDGCNIADLISTGACFRSIINAMTSLFVATIIYYTGTTWKISDICWTEQYWTRSTATKQKYNQTNKTVQTISVKCYGEIATQYLGFWYRYICLY